MLLTLHKKIKFSIKDLVTFTEEILNGKLHYLCSVNTFGKLTCDTLTLFYMGFLFHTSEKRDYLKYAGNMKFHANFQVYKI